MALPCKGTVSSVLVGELDVAADDEEVVAEDCVEDWTSDEPELELSSVLTVAGDPSAGAGIVLTIS